VWSKISENLFTVFRKALASKGPFFHLSFSFILHQSFFFILSMSIYGNHNGFWEILACIFFNRFLSFIVFSHFFYPASVIFFIQVYSSLII